MHFTKKVNMTDSSHKRYLLVLKNQLVDVMMAGVRCLGCSSPIDARTAAFDVDKLRLPCSRVAAVAEMVVVWRGTHIFPANAHKKAHRITLIKSVVGKLFPHLHPLWMVCLKKFHVICSPKK